MTTSHIKAIVFDFGGVLLGWDPRRLYQRYFPGQPQAMEDFLTEVGFHEWNLQQDKGRPFAQATALLSAEFPHRAQLIGAYFENYEESLTGPIAGSIHLLQRLKAGGHPLYGLTNWSSETFPRARRQYGFFDLFDDIVVSGAVNHIKPEPEIYHILLQKIGRPAQDCLLIDDSLPNVQQAQRLGFDAVRFESPEQLESALRERNLL